MPSPAPAIATSPLAEHFQQLVRDWKMQSRYLTNSAQMAMLKPYQRIIGMGQPAVPLLLQELGRETDHWYWALESITGVNPVRPEHLGKIRLMAQDWLDWGKEQGYSVA